MSSRYPLTRVHIYKTQAEAISHFNVARRTPLPNVTFSMSNLTIEDKYIKYYFISDIINIRGLQIDKAVFFHEPTTEELNEIRMSINPYTTVEKPITIEMLP